MGHSRTFLLRGAGTGVTTSATGTTNTLAKFTGASAIGDSLVKETGSTVYIGTNARAATTPGFGVSGASPGMFWDETDAAADAKVWSILAEGTALQFLCVNDAVNNSNPWLAVARSGFVPSTVTVTADLKLSAAGNGLFVKEGTNATMGVVTLSGAAGSAIVYTTKLTAATRIFITEQNSGGTPGVVRVTSSTNLVSFTITSSSITDTSAVAWFLIQQA